MKKIAFSVLVFLLSLNTSYAGLIGDTIDWQYYAYGGKYNGLGSPGSFIAGSTTDSFEGYFTISATDTQITFDYSGTSATSWSPSSTAITDSGLTVDNGIELFNIDSLLTSVTLNAATNMVGLTNSNIDFNANALAISWQNLAFDTNTRVVLDVNASSVPLPAPLALLGLGLAAIGFTTRKRKA